MPTKHNIKCYGLSTCGHCRQLREWLAAQNLAHDFVEVDQLSGEAKQAALRAVREVNPSCSFPTILIDDQTVIVGFREDRLRQALEL